MIMIARLLMLVKNCSDLTTFACLSCVMQKKIMKKMALNARFDTILTHFNLILYELYEFQTPLSVAKLNEFLNMRCKQWHH